VSKFFEKLRYVNVNKFGTEFKFFIDIEIQDQGSEIRKKQQNLYIFFLKNTNDVNIKKPAFLQA
jgi:hypothetical protein